jgi:hypothetical protein
VAKLLADKAIVFGWRRRVCRLLEDCYKPSDAGLGSLILPNAVSKGREPDPLWVEVDCVYLAPDEETIREHARRGGFPANRVSAVRRLIDPSTAG